MHKDAHKEKEQLKLNLAHTSKEAALKAATDEANGVTNGGAVNATNGVKGPGGSPGTDQNRNTNNTPAKGRGKGRDRTGAGKLFRSMSVSSIDLSKSTSKDASPTLSPVPSPSMDDLPVATADAVSRALELPTIEIRALKTELSRVQGLLDDHIAEEGRMTQR